MAKDKYRKSKDKAASENDMVETCRQCFEEYPFVLNSDGFCSDTCVKEYNKEIAAWLEKEHDESKTDPETTD